MSTPQRGNHGELLRLWAPAVVFSVVVGGLVIAALTSGDPMRNIPIAIGLFVAAALVFGGRWRQKRRIARMLQLTDPSALLRSFAASAARIPHGPLLAAANAATILALYGRAGDAERELESVSWADVTPLLQAQASAARAVMAYAQGSLTEGLDHAVAAGEQGSVNSAVPGAATSELAFRTYRNLGLALTGRATNTNADELRSARERLPLVGQLLAAWGLAVIARDTGDDAEFQSMRSFIEQRAPHFAPVLKTLRPAPTPSSPSPSP